MKARDEEVFGPVVTLQAFGTPEEAFAEVNDSRFRLQVGVFTCDLQVAFEAQTALEMDGVVIGAVASHRAEQMPYLGVKESGRGCEGRGRGDDRPHLRARARAPRRAGLRAANAQGRRP